MGVEIHTDQFGEADRARFVQRLHEQLGALEAVLGRPDFGAVPRTVGAELELSLVDGDGRALAISEQIVSAANTPTITPEMGAFDIELSTPPVGFAGTPFSALGASMRKTVNEIFEIARRYGGRAVPISILPTLRGEDFHGDAITNLPRYRALANGLRAARRSPFEIAIEGDDSLRFKSPDVVAMEAANTAFQVHVTTRPDEFADLFNAALLLSGPVIAAAANSPTFLGRRLWHETRVALFKQAGDDRPNGPDSVTAMPPRVNFGNGWVRQSAHELFMESVMLHQPLLPECSDYENAMEIVKAGQLPQLRELRLHHGTVWSWNRPVYDPDNGGNLRIELRALPAGPSYDDMLANACFLVGAMLSIKDRIPLLVGAMPFVLAKQNFFNAAKLGLDAMLAWPPESGHAPVNVRAKDLLLSLVPEARSALHEAGVEPDEADRYLGIFEERVRTGITGAVWQLKVLERLRRRGLDGYAAFTGLLARYMEQFDTDKPVHTWPLEASDEGKENYV